MKELKCPKCGNIFQVDDAEYASIANQVKNQEFEAELERRIAERQAAYDAQQSLASTKAEKAFQDNLNKKELEISAKNAEIDRIKAENASSLEKLSAEKDKVIAQLKNELSNIGSQKDAAMTIALAEKDKTIAALNATISQEESKLQIAVMEEHKRLQQTIDAKNNEITQLKSDVKLEQLKAKNDAEMLVAQHKRELQLKEEEVNYYKDYKARLSTKMIGESLEIHCSTLYEQQLRPHMPTASFDKDNEIVDGTKGDFVFRDYYEDNGNKAEYVSIMFEMKNESDTTVTKHKNEDFLKKLDADRKKKKCEFAVLVSLLEPENELYNGGIVNVSHLYEKMYVIRPQFFIPLITLIVQTSKKSIEYKKQLVLAQNKEVDVTNFEEKLNEFKENFGRHYGAASRKFEDAIRQIDDTISKLQKVKESLLGSEKQLRLANQDTEKLTIKKLTHNNKTMKQKFEEARASSSQD